MSANAEIEQLVKRLADAGWKERDGVKEELLAAAQAMNDRDRVTSVLEELKRGIPNLEIRWEIDEVIEALEPPKPVVVEEEEPEEQPEDPNRPLTASDLNLVYDDPRGLMLYKAKKGERWFATQVDPNTGQPQMFELHPSEVQQLQDQLKGSPYWVLGAGAAR